MVELLVAMAVLALVLVVMTQAVNGVLQSTRAQNQQMDSVAVARRALDVMAGDLRVAVIDNQRTVLVPDTNNSPTLFTLYADRRGPSGATAHRYLAVAYSINNSQQLFRTYGSENFTTQGAQADIDPPAPLAAGILAFQMRALTENGSNIPVQSSPSANWSATTYNGEPSPSELKALIFARAPFASELTNRTRGLELWIAAADPQTISVLTDTDTLSTAQNLLAGEADPHQWRTKIDDESTIPAPAKSGIRILRKTISKQ